MAIQLFINAQFNAFLYYNPKSNDLQDLRTKWDI